MSAFAAALIVLAALLLADLVLDYAAYALGWHSSADRALRRSTTYSAVAGLWGYRLALGTAAPLPLTSLVRDALIVIAAVLLIEAISRGRARITASNHHKEPSP